MGRDLANPSRLRQRMVQEQLIPRGIRDPRVLDAVQRVERHRFIPAHLQSHAYEDRPLPIGHRQTISQPYIVALMSEALRFRGTESILEVGTGSGYHTAVLAELAGSVYTVERCPELSSRARELLTSLEYRNITFRLGDGTLGWDAFSPYRAIVVTAAAKAVPEPLLAQLAPSGQLIIPLGGPSGQTLTLFKKSAEGLETTELCPCLFVPMLSGAPR